MRKLIIALSVLSLTSCHNKKIDWEQSEKENYILDVIMETQWYTDNMSSLDALGEWFSVEWTDRVLEKFGRETGYWYEPIEM